MASITQDQALAELKARGIDPAKPSIPTAPAATIDPAEAMAELKARGIEIPKPAEPPLNSPLQPSAAQQQQYPISSMISKGLGTGMEALSAPFQVAGEAIRGAGAGEPLQVATAKNPQGFRAPTLLQHFMPSLRTPEAPADPFQQAAMGLKGVATTAANLPQGPGQAIQSGAQAVQGPAGPAENLGAMAMGVGTGEAGNLPFTAAVKPFAELGELIKTGHLGGVPGSGEILKSMTGMDAVPLGLENLTARANPEVLETAAKNNVPLTPAGITGSPTHAAIEGFLRKLPFSSNIMQERFSQQLAALGKVREPIVEATKPAADLGLDVQEAISNTSNTAYKNAQSLYQNAENAIPEGTKIPVNKLSDAASNVLKAQAKLPAGAQTGAASQLLKDLAGQGFEGKDIGRIMPEGTQVTGKAVSEFDYPTIQALRAELNDRIAKANSAFGSNQPGAKFQSSPEARIYGNLKDALDKDLTAFSDKTGGAFKSALDNANKTYSTYKDVYKNDNFVQSILNEQNPEKVIDKVMKAATDNPRALGTLKLNLPTQTLNDLQTYFVKNMTEKDPNVFSPAHFVSQYNSIGEKRLTDILGPDKLAQLRPLYVLSKASLNAEKLGQSATGPSGAGMVAGAIGLTQPVMMAMREIAHGKPLEGLGMASGMIGAEMAGLPLVAKAYLSKPVGNFLTRQASLPSFPAAAAAAPIIGKTQASVTDLIQQLKDKYAQRRKM